MGGLGLSQPIGRRLFFGLLYLSEGAPIGYVWWAMPTRLRQAGMPVEEVSALIAMLTLPWAFKFLWAPAIDRLRGPRFGYRGWITVAQVMMGLTLLPFGVLGAEAISEWATLLLLMHAFSAATQDVGIDALAIATIPESERAQTTGWMQAGMLMGRAVFGGVALAAECWIGAEAVVLVLIGVIWATLVMLWLMPGVNAETRASDRAERQPFFRVLGRVLGRRSTWLGIGIALIAGAGFEAVGGLIGPMLSDAGASKEAVGYYLAIPVVLLMIVGGLAGGRVADRLGHRRVLIWCIAIISCFSGLISLLMRLETIHPYVLMSAAGPIYLLIGCMIASSYALFMDLSEVSIGGTQFSAFMGATNLCEVWAVALAGGLAGSFGYSIGFSATAALSLLAIPLVVWLPAPSKATASETISTGV